MKSFSFAVFLTSMSVIAGQSFGQGPGPRLSYLIPDIGAPGMNTYTEFIAPYNAIGTFGTDGVYANNPGDPVRVVCARPLDTAKLTIGPIVVGWNGREISTQIFIGTCASPNSSTVDSLDSAFKIPLKIIVNGVASNVDTFFIVKPFAGLNASGGGILGGGDQWGLRSKRGALIFDSITLNGGTYTVSTADCDPATPGNQGFLPVTILSKGPVRLLNDAALSVSSPGYDGGPGGGGGSMGDGPPDGLGGNGFVGGSPGESAGVCPSTGGTGTGGTGDVNGGGIGLNGIPTERSDVPQCEYFGGTGNPFISSGGGVLSPSKHEGDGNGGGFGTAGQNGYGSRGYAEDLGGIANGNPMLVPLMGGSGGGGGNEFCSCASTPPGCRAGGGGGGLVLFSTALTGSAGSVSSNGASGVTGGVGCSGHGSVGGCGSGGGIVLESKLAASFPSVSAAGGVSIHTHADNGSGGAGRVRFDGPIATAITISPASATSYRGLSTDTTNSSAGSVTLTGSGNGDTIRIYTKTGPAPWQLAATIGNYSNNQWSHSLAAPPGLVTYVVAMQQVPDPSRDTAMMEPSWVMSQAAANIINAVSTSTSPTPQLASEPFIPVTGCSDTSVWEPISIGCTEFRIDSVRIEGDGHGVFHLDSKQKLPRTIGYYGSDSVHVVFVPLGQAGTFQGFVHVFGTLVGSGAKFDTLLPLQATSTSTGNPLPSIRYAPFIPVQSCEDGDAYAFLKLGCAQFRIDSVRIEQDTANAFGLDPTQKYPFTLLANKSDSIHVLFDPNNRLGSYGATLHVFGTDLGSGTGFDTVLTLTASSVLPTPVFYTYPPQIAWSSVVECASGDTSITFQNHGCDTVSVDSLHVLAGLTLSAQGLTLPKRIPPNSSITLKVHFSPDGMSSDSLSALLFYSATGFFDSIPVQVFATPGASPPVLTAEQPKVNFGQLAACDTADTVVYLKNTGCDSLTITSLSNMLGDFSNNPAITIPVTIGKGDSIALHFRYRPSSPRDTQSVFVGTKNGGHTGSVKLSLSGQIGVDELSLSELPIGLSAVAVCGSDDTSITLSNPGCDTMVITSASLYPAGDVQLGAMTLPIILLPHSDTAIHLHFSARTAEFVSTTLTVIYSSAGIEQPEITIPIHALSTNPTELLDMSDTALSIAALPICKTDSLFATLYNSSCDTITVSANALAGDPDFVLLSKLDSLRVPPEDSLRVKIEVIPQAKGSRTAVLQVKYWGTNGEHDSTIDLSATIIGGVGGVKQSLLAAALGTVTECSNALDTMVTLTNNGCDTMTIDTATLNNSDVLLSPVGQFPVRIPPDSSFTWFLQTNLDTSGHPTNLSSILNFASKDVTLSPITLSYSAKYRLHSTLELVPMTGAARADSSVYYDIRDGDTLKYVGVTDVHFALHTSQDLLGYDSATSLNAVASSSSYASGIANYDFEITGTPILQDRNGTLARLWFKAFIAQDTETAVWIDSTRFNPTDVNFERCVASLLPPPDTTFDLIPACGNLQMRDLMNGSSITLRVLSSGDRTLLVIHSPEAVVAHLRISNVLGATVDEESVPLIAGETEFVLPPTIPSGPMFMMLSDDEGVVARAEGLTWK